MNFLVTVLIVDAITTCTMCEEFIFKKFVTVAQTRVGRAKCGSVDRR